MKRLLLDQGIGRSVVTILNAKGWDVTHVGDIGLQRADDELILEHGRKDNRVCVTLDADFHMHLALQNASSPSAIRIRIEGLKSDAIAELLLREWPRLETALERGAVVTITERGTRLRSLPIQ